MFITIASRVISVFFSRTDCSRTPAVRANLVSRVIDPSLHSGTKLNDAPRRSLKKYTRKKIITPDFCNLIPKKYFSYRGILLENIFLFIKSTYFENYFL